jgi:actin-related protein
VRRQAEEEQARRQAEEEQARRQAEEKQARRQAEEEQARRQAEEEQARKQAEEEQAEEEEAEEKQAEEEEAEDQKQEARRKKFVEAQDLLKRDAEDQAAKVAETQAKKEEQAKKEAEEQAKKEAEEQAKKKAEEQAKKKAEEQAKKKAEEQARLEATKPGTLEREVQPMQQVEMGIVRNKVTGTAGVRSDVGALHAQPAISHTVLDGDTGTIPCQQAVLLAVASTDNVDQPERNESMLYLRLGLEFRHGSFEKPTLQLPTMKTMGSPTGSGHISTLCLAHCSNFSPADAVVLASAMTGEAGVCNVSGSTTSLLPHLRVLDLSCTKLLGEYFDELEGLLAICTALAGVGSGGAVARGDAMESVPLPSPRSRPTQTPTPALLPATAPPLESLSLSSIGLGASTSALSTHRACAALSAALASNGSLSAIDLSANVLGPAASCILANGLLLSRSLRTISLRQNEICAVTYEDSFGLGCLGGCNCAVVCTPPNEGASALAIAGLHQVYGLESLCRALLGGSITEADISSNCLGAIGAGVVSVMLRAQLQTPVARKLTRSLNTVILADNNICKAIAESMAMEFPAMARFSITPAPGDSAAAPDEQPQKAATGGGNWRGLI